MDIPALIDGVCQQLSNRPLYSQPLGHAGAAGAGGSRHSRLYGKRCVAEMQEEGLPLTYRHAVDVHLRRYQTLIDTPVNWNGYAEESRLQALKREREMTGIRMAVMALTSEMASDFLPVRDNTASNHDTSPSAGPGGCPACQSNPPHGGIGTGTCGFCQGVMYENLLNHQPIPATNGEWGGERTQYQNHHTIGSVRPGLSTTDASRETPASQKQKEPTEIRSGSEEERDHHRMRVAPGVGGSVPEGNRDSSVTMYQRRSQFRVALAAYQPDPSLSLAQIRPQGKATRPVPEEIVDDVRRLLEGTSILTRSLSENRNCGTATGRPSTTHKTTAVFDTPR
jgi:hypothetical protein